MIALPTGSAPLLGRICYCINSPLVSQGPASTCCGPGGDCSPVRPELPRHLVGPEIRMIQQTGSLGNRDCLESVYCTVIYLLLYAALSDITNHLPPTSFNLIIVLLRMFVCHSISVQRTSSRSFAGYAGSGLSIYLGFEVSTTQQATAASGSWPYRLVIQL